METNLKIVGFANQSINGENISNQGIHVNYDGKQADINAFNNGKMYYMHLDKNDINKLLSKTSSHIPLEKRLITDFQQTDKKCLLQFRKPTPYHITKQVTSSYKSKKNKIKNNKSKKNKKIKSKKIKIKNNKSKKNKIKKIKSNKIKSNKIKQMYKDISNNKTPYIDPIDRTIY